MWTESSAILRHRQQESTAANGGRRGLGCVMGVPTLKRARHLRRRTARGGERLRSITWRQDLRLLMWSSVAYNGEAHYIIKIGYHLLLLYIIIFISNQNKTSFSPTPLLGGVEQTTVKKTETALALASASTKLMTYHPSFKTDGRKNKYYVKQFATLRSFKEVESLNVPCVVDDEALELEEQEQSEFAMKISNYANLALLGIKGIVRHICCCHGYSRWIDAIVLAIYTIDYINGSGTVWEFCPHKFLVHIHVLMIILLQELH
ncbi:hypothetical protein OPV22_022986 [Ensete ventricosum]|uniref:Uncharacterized protein n=1 Tax=Ensete ventricosum TaxID=4639 RepID=A0AAV8QVM7_ENSVE|nr:hypothetical protein OPV22_022986 [Ensete ventricosum]